MVIGTIYDFILFVLLAIMMIGFDIFTFVGTYYYIKDKKAEYKKEELKVTNFTR